MATGTPPPPGWYIDPSGTGNQRWWDGVKWTEHLHAVDSPQLPPPDGETPAEPTTENPSELLRDWKSLIEAVPERSTLSPVIGRIPKDFGPSRLPGRPLEEIGRAYGRPSWWLPEPATGGLIVGWSRRPGLAVHFDSDAACDQTFTRGENELDLSWRLRTLGNVTQRSMDEVISWLGEPNSRSGGGSYILLQWQRTGFHIGLKFNSNKKCLGITHQYIARPTRAR